MAPATGRAVRSAGILAALLAALSFPGISAADGMRWSLAVAPELATAWPSGGFGAPPAEPLFHLAGRALLRCGDAPLALRLDGGGATLRTRVPGVEVAWPTPAFRTTLAPVRAGTDLWWLAAGAQWEPDAAAGGPYAFMTAGVTRVRPSGDARVGSDVSFDLPGLPGDTTTWRLAAGAGLAIPLDAEARGAFVCELEYARGGDVDYVAARGVDGGYPDAHYAARRARLALIGLRFGVSAKL